MMNLGKRLRERRVALGLTQADLAKQLGVTHSTISQIESGKTKRTYRVVELSRALGVPAHWLAAGEDTTVADAATQDAAPLQRLVEKLRQLSPEVIGIIDQIADAHLRESGARPIHLCAQPACRQINLGGHHV